MALSRLREPGARSAPERPRCRLRRCAAVFRSVRDVGADLTTSGDAVADSIEVETKIDRRISDGRWARPKPSGAATCPRSTGRSTSKCSGGSREAVAGAPSRGPHGACPCWPCALGLAPGAATQTRIARCLEPDLPLSSSSGAKLPLGATSTSGDPRGNPAGCWSWLTGKVAQDSPGPSWSVRVWPRRSSWATRRRVCRCGWRRVK